MNRNTMLYLSTIIGATMGMGYEVADGHCEKDGKHCTFLKGDLCSCYGVPLEIDSEGHKKCGICETTNCMIARTK